MFDGSDIAYPAPSLDFSNCGVEDRGSIEEEDSVEEEKPFYFPDGCVIEGHLLGKGNNYRS